MKVKRPWDKLTKISRKDKVTGERIKVGSNAKRALHEHLWREQKGLCIYCMQEIHKTRLNSDSHLEHLMNKSQFKELIFEYDNLSVSCNGYDCSTDQDSKGKNQFCGHYKDKKNKKPEFIAEKYINPCEDENIESYFEYDVEGRIKPARNIEPDIKGKASYMIDLINLNDDGLVSARKAAYESLIESEIQEGEKFVLDLLDEKNKFFLGYHSMLKSLFGF